MSMIGKIFGFSQKSSETSNQDDNIYNNINNIIMNNDIIKNIISDNVSLKEENKQLRELCENSMKIINENKEQINMLISINNSESQNIKSCENKIHELEVLIKQQQNIIDTNNKVQESRNIQIDSIIEHNNIIDNKINNIIVKCNNYNQQIDLIEKNINNMLLYEDFNNTINQYVLKSDYQQYQHNIDNFIEESKNINNKFISNYEPIINELSTYIINHKNDSLNYMNKSEYTELINIINDKLSDYTVSELFNKTIDNINYKLNNIDDVLHSLPVAISSISQLNSRYNDHAQNILTLHSKINCIGELERRIISLTEKFNNFYNDNVTKSNIYNKNNVNILSEQNQSIENNDNEIITNDNENDNDIINNDNNDNTDNITDIINNISTEKIINEDENTNDSSDSSIVSSTDIDTNIDNELYEYYKNMKTKDLKDILKLHNIDVKNMKKKDLIIKCLEISKN